MSLKSTAILLPFLAVAGCDSSVAVVIGRCEDSVVVDRVYDATGVAVRDTLDAHSAFTVYVNSTREAGHGFPDGSPSWRYVRSRPDPWGDMKLWRVEYDYPDRSGEFGWVHVDGSGLILNAILIVHAPC